MHDTPRPRTRAECPPHPCPFVSCRYHLLAHVNERSGSLVLNHGHDDPTLLAYTCALDAAEIGTHTLAEIGEALSLTRERTRQIETAALAKIKRLNPGVLAALEGK